MTIYHLILESTRSRPTRFVRPFVVSWVAEALGGDGPDIERLGVSTDEVRQFALDGLTRRLGIIGVPVETL